MARILIIGGTGAMGHYLAPKMAVMGHDVYVVSRHRPLINAGKICYLCGNAMNDAFLHEVFSIVHPDAVVDFMHYSSSAFAKRYKFILSNTTHYVFLSSCRVFAGEDIHSEDSPRLLDVCTDMEYMATDDYALAKARSEDMLKESSFRNWTIARPCIAFSSPRFQFGCLEANTFICRALQGLPSVIPEEMLDKRTSMIGAEDVAEMLSRIVLNKDAMGESFNTVTAESPTWREVAQYYAETIGMSYEVCSLEEYKRICPNNLWQLKYGRMVHHSFDNSKVLSALNMKQSDIMPLREALKSELNILMRNPRILQPDIACNARMDDYCGTNFRFHGAIREHLRYYAIRNGRLYSLIQAIRGR